MDRYDEEMLELEAPRPANTSTSSTLALSEELHVAPETSPPTYVAPEASAPARSPRASKKKKARTGVAGKQEIATGSLLTSLLDDVRYLFLSVTLFAYSNNFQILDTIFLSVNYFVALDEGDG
jgi:hypothetical protein